MRTSPRQDPPATPGRRHTRGDRPASVGWQRRHTGLQSIHRKKRPSTLRQAHRMRHWLLSLMPTRVLVSSSAAWQSKWMQPPNSTRQFPSVDGNKGRPPSIPACNAEVCSFLAFSCKAFSCFPSLWPRGLRRSRRCSITGFSLLSWPFVRHHHFYTPPLCLHVMCPLAAPSVPWHPMV